MNNNQTPIARRNGIVVKKLSRETLVYDTERHQAHCLNQQASLVWENCDGIQTIRDLSDLLNTDENMNDYQKQQIIWITVNQLEKANLLEGSITKLETVKGMTRRQLIKVAGIAGLIAIPVVSTMVAPTAAEASTCLASGQSCASSAECCSGLCSVNVCV